MVRIELTPTLGHCIETRARQEYWKSVKEYLELGEENKKLEEKIELLKMFLESMDFRELRRQSEKYLVEEKSVRFILYLKEGNPEYEIEVE